MRSVLLNVSMDSGLNYPYNTIQVIEHVFCAKALPRNTHSGRRLPALCARHSIHIGRLPWDRPAPRSRVSVSPAAGVVGDYCVTSTVSEPGGWPAGAGGAEQVACVGGGVGLGPAVAAMAEEL